MRCIFCGIASGALPAGVMYRDPELIAFADLNPAAPTHLLVCTIAHYDSAAQLEERDAALLGRLFAAATRLGRERGGGGFRLVVNTGNDGGQTVDHVHVHVLAGRHMGWPPG
ncbi:MAG: HIT domain-containing protein [Vulcanimicrobiaceae bacterium]